MTHGYTYKLKIVYAHFPSHREGQGQQRRHRELHGRALPRTSRIVGDCKVKVEGDDVIVNGVSLEDVGQTAANVELATKVKRKDQRIFLDGVYIFEKGKGTP